MYHLAVSAPPARLSLLLLGAVALAPRAASADPVSEPESVAAAKTGTLPALAALGPGFVVSGAGHYLAGDRETGKKLLLVQGAGLAAATTAGVPLLVTRASRRLPGATYHLFVGGIGVFLVSWLADVYGASGGARVGAEPRVEPPLVEVDLGYGFVGDPQIAAGHFVAASAELLSSGFRVRPSIWASVDADNRRSRFELAHRLRGPGARAPARDGSFVEVGAAVTHHRFGDEAFASMLGEVFVGGRYDMRRLAPTLAGSFAELAGGIGLQRLAYDVAAAHTDWFDLLLLRFGYGMYLGQPGQKHGELSIFYDHRRDDFAGGLSPGRGNGSGFAGYFGVAGFARLARLWGISAEVELGAALVARVGLRYRLEGAR